LIVTETELEITIATPDDVHDVMALALMACEENGFVNPNPQKLLQDIWPAVNRDHGLVAVIRGENGLEGALLLRIGTMWYSDDQVIEEKAIFIHPEYRNAKGGRARRLSEYAKKVSDELGIPLVIGVLSNERTAAKVRMYERQFGKPSGAYWIYGARTGQHAKLG
jgi:hypothetical protein